jgi:hypothetical protein
LGVALEGQITTGGELDARLGRDSEAARAAVERLEAATQVADRLQRVRDELAPWQHLLVDVQCEPDGMPKPVASMIESLRVGLGRDMAAISATMRELAQRVEDLGLPQPAQQDLGERAEIVTNVEESSVP